MPPTPMQSAAAAWKKKTSNIEIFNANKHTHQSKGKQMREKMF